MARSALGAFRSTPTGVLAGESGHTPARALLGWSGGPKTKGGIGRPTGRCYGAPGMDRRQRSPRQLQHPPGSGSLRAGQEQKDPGNHLDGRIPAWFSEEDEFVWLFFFFFFFSTSSVFFFSFCVRRTGEKEISGTPHYDRASWSGGRKWVYRGKM